MVKIVMMNARVMSRGLKKRALTHPCDDTGQVMLMFESSKNNESIGEEKKGGKQLNRGSSNLASSDTVYGDHGIGED